MTDRRSIANRHMLYAEILAGWFSASTGIAVWLSHGMLKQLVERLAGDRLYQGMLGAPLIAFGGMLVSVCIFELICGRGWSETALWRASLWRQWLNMAVCLCHFALLVALVQMHVLWATPGLTLNSVGLILVCAMAVYKARRLCFALDPKYPTERLRREIQRSW